MLKDRALDLRSAYLAPDPASRTAGAISLNEQSRASRERVLGPGHPAPWRLRGGHGNSGLAGQARTPPLACSRSGARMAWAATGWAGCLRLLSRLGCAAVAAAQRSFDIALEVQGCLLAGEVQVAFPCALDAVERRVLADGQVGVGAEDMRVAR